MAGVSIWRNALDAWMPFGCELDGFVMHQGRVPAVVASACPFWLALGVALGVVLGCLGCLGCLDLSGLSDLSLSGLSGMSCSLLDSCRFLSVLPLSLASLVKCKCKCKCKMRTRVFS